MSRVRDALTDVRRVITPTGYGVLLLGASGFIGHHYLGHEEMLLVGVVCLALLVVALPFVLVPTRVTSRLSLRSTHTVAGDTGRAVLHVRNRSPLPLLHPGILIPIGRDSTRLRLPLLRRDVEHAETHPDPDLPPRRRRRGTGHRPSYRPGGTAAPRGEVGVARPALRAATDGGAGRDDQRLPARAGRASPATGSR